MQIQVIRADGSLDLGNEGEIEGFRPGVAVQVVRLSTGNLLLIRMDNMAPPGAIDLTPLLARHGRRAHPRKAIDNGTPSE